MVYCLRFKGREGLGLLLNVGDVINTILTPAVSSKERGKNQQSLSYNICLTEP